MNDKVQDITELPKTSSTWTKIKKAAAVGTAATVPVLLVLGLAAKYGKTVVVETPKI